MAPPLSPASHTIEWVVVGGMSISGSFRPGHTEREVLRDYVVGKTVEEVVVSRKAQFVLGAAEQANGTPRSGALQGERGDTLHSPCICLSVCRSVGLSALRWVDWPIRLCC